MPPTPEEQAILDLQKAQKALNELRAEGVKDIAAYIRATEDLKLAEDNLQAAFGNTTNTVKAYNEALKHQSGLVSEFNKKMFDAIPVVGKWRAGIEDLTKQMGGLTNATRASTLGTMALQASMLAVVGTTFKVATEIDNATVSFRRATGMTGMFDDNIVRATHNLKGYGVGAHGAANAIQGLLTNVTDYVFMSEAQQDTLAHTVSILDKMGLSAGTSSKALQFQMKVFGMNAKGAERSQREMLQLARELGVPVEQLGQDFNAMVPALAALGRDGTRAFRDLEAAAKATGIPAQRILNIVSQFDTFEGAANAVGKLNAILGGPFLNSMEMVATTDPTERFRLMKGAIDDAGLAFDDMDYYQRKAIASAMGLQDASELALIMSGRTDLMAGASNKSAEEIERLAEQTKDFNTVAEEMAEIGRMLAISMGPLVSMFKGLLQWIQPLIPAIKSVVVGIAGTVAVVGLLVGKITGIIPVLSALLAIVFALGEAFIAFGHIFTVGASPPLLDTLSAANKEMDSLAKTTDAINKNGVSGTNMAATTSLAAATAMAKQVEGITASITSGRGDVYLDGRVIGEVIDKGTKSTLENGMLSSYS